jgi:ATP-binding cassette subfamily B protein
VLSWWAIAAVLTRTATTLTILAIIVVGTLLHVNGKATIGEMVTFMNFAGLVIARLEATVTFVNGMVSQAPRLREFFQVWDTIPDIRDRPNAIDPGRLDGRVIFRDVAFSYDHKRPAVVDLNFQAMPGETIALVGATGAGKSFCTARSIRSPGASKSTARTSASSSWRHCGGISVSCFRKHCCSTARLQTTCGSANPTPPTKNSATPRAAPRPWSSSTASSTGSIRKWASGAAPCPAANANACPSPVRC